MKLSRYVVLAAPLLLPTIGCDEVLPTAPPPPPTVTVIVEQTQNVGVQEPPAPGESPSPSEVGFDSIRIGIFGHAPNCANAPRNGESVVRLGCTAFATATPKLKGVDVPATVHGPSCIWYLNGERVNGEASNGVVSVFVQSNPFNLDMRGLAPGTFTLEAEVKGARSGVKGFAVE